MIPFTGGVTAVYCNANQAWIVQWGQSAILKGPCPKDEALRYIREVLQCRRIDP